MFPMQTLYFVYILICVALIFDFFNGFHDAANSVATVVTTGPRSRVMPIRISHSEAARS